VVTYPFTVSKLKGTLNLTTDGRDSCALIGKLPGMPARFKPAGAVMTVNIGGAEVVFTFGANAKASNANGKAALKLKPSVRNAKTKKAVFAGGAMVFSATLAKGAWADDWALIGLDASADRKAAPVTVPVLVSFNGRLYGASATVKFTAKAGKSGKFAK
jgi:hypothetical protein